jgi:spermidine synthase
VAYAVTWLLSLCFTISGAAALALEMLWVRSAALIFGQTAATAATVLACYFGGLGLGAAVARGVRRGAVRVYGRLEIGAAAGALWSLAAFGVLATDGGQRCLGAGGLAGRIAAVAVAVLPATVCLGATLPALGQALAAGAVGRCGGWLYAVNTLGGVAGIAAAGFGLPAAIGVRASYAAAAAVSAVAGGLALIVGRWHEDGTVLTAGPVVDRPEGAPLDAPPRAGGYSGRTDLISGNQAFLRSSRVGPIFPGAVSRGQPVSHGRLRLVAAGAGALGLGLEVLWTRLFAQVLHNSVYSFSAIALVFLVAIAAGAAVAAVLVQRISPTSLAPAALLGAAVATVAGFWLFVQRTDGLAYVGMQSGLGEYIGRIVALAAVSAGPAACASGVVLPVLWSAWGGADGAARPLGDLSAANTVGGIAGALAGGFLGVPMLGVRGSLLAAAVAYVALAAVLAPQPRRWRVLAAAALFAVVIFTPLHAPLVHLRSGDGREAETLRATAEGPSGIVSVVETDGDLQLRLDNFYVLGGSAAATNERRLGLVPLLLHPAPHRVLFIGLATGITASAGPALGVARTTVVEVVPEVAAAARAYFTAWNGDLLDRPDVQLVLDDGRRYLAASREQFDVIVSDLFIPWHAGAGNLYSREMYETVARRLAPGGLFCQWLPLYQLTRNEFDMITRTFMSVFPQVSLWRGDFYPNRPVVGLVGRFGAPAVDLTRVGERLAQLPAWSRDSLLSAPRGLAMLSAGPLTPVADLFKAAALNTDDRPLLEFTAPRLTRINAAGDKDWFTGEALADFYERLAARTAQTPDLLLPASEDVTEARRAGMLLYRYALAASADDTVAAARLESQVRALVPEVISTAEAADNATDLAAARRTLDGLRAEQEEVQRHLSEVEQRLGQLAHAEEDAR